MTKFWFKNKEANNKILNLFNEEKFINLIELTEISKKRLERIKKTWLKIDEFDLKELSIIYKNLIMNKRKIEEWILNLDNLINKYKTYEKISDNVKEFYIYKLNLTKERLKLELNSINKMVNEFEKKFSILF